jgi:hypothetical protein
LHVAASEGHLHVCKYLIEEKKCRINRSDRWGGSPLDDAHRHRHTEIIVYLRKRGARTGSNNVTTNLIKAAAEGDVDEVKLLIGVTTPAPQSLSSSLSPNDENRELDHSKDNVMNNSNNNKSNSNHQQQQQQQKIRELNQGDYDKRTALHLAAGEGHAMVVRLLCQSGADVNVEDRWSRRPLDDAIQGKHNECIDILKSFGAAQGQTRVKTVSNSDSLDHSSQRQRDNLHVDFQELQLIDRIGSGAFGEIYKCRWRGTLTAAKIIKSAKIRREWVNKQIAAAVAAGKDIDDAIKELDEAEIAQNDKDAAIADFRQEISVLKSLRHPHIVLLLGYSTTVR